MSTTIAAASGAKIYLGYAKEGTPGTFQSITNWIPVDPDKVNFTFDTARKGLELATGTLLADAFFVEEAAKVEGTVAFPLFPDMGQSLIFLSGFIDALTAEVVSTSPTVHTGTITQPKSVSIEINRSGQSTRYAGLIAKSIKWTCSSKSYAMVEIAFEGTVAPVIPATPSTPTFANDAEQPYVWGNMQSVTLMNYVNDTTFVKDVDDLEIEMTWANELFYGANATHLPTTIVIGPVMIKGKFTKLFESQTEYVAWYESFDTTVPGELLFTLIKATSPAWSRPQVSWLMPTAIYTKHEWKHPLKGAVVEDFEFEALSYDGGMPLTYVVENIITATQYSTT